MVLYLWSRQMNLPTSMQPARQMQAMQCEADWIPLQATERLHQHENAKRCMLARRLTGNSLYGHPLGNAYTFKEFILAARFFAVLMSACLLYRGYGPVLPFRDVRIPLQRCPTSEQTRHTEFRMQGSTLQSRSRRHSVLCLGTRWRICP